MPISSSIYSQVGQIQQPQNALDALTRATQLQGAQQQNQLGSMKMDEYQREVGQKNKLLQLLGGDYPDDEARAGALIKGGFLKEGQDYRKGLVDNKKASADVQKTQIETAHKKLETAGQAFGYVKDNPTPDAANQAVQFLVQNGIWDQPTAQAALAKVQENPTPEGIKALATQAYQSALSAKDQLPKIETQNLGSTSRVSAVNPVTLGQTTISDTKIAESEAQRLARERMSSDAAAGRAVTMRGQNMTDARQREATTGGDGMTPAAIENAAARYNLDGTLPPMGMGKAAAAGRKEILNRAAELAMGTSGADQRIGQLDTKAAATALNQISKTHTMTAAFERTANANADLALGLSGKLDRTGVPLLNAGLQAWRTGTGSPEATQFAAANDTFVAEYAKIMSGGMGNSPVSDSARHKAETLLKTSMTKDQYAGNVKLLQTEMQNRMKGFEDQTAELRKRMSQNNGGGVGRDGVAAPAAAPKEVHFDDLK